MIFTEFITYCGLLYSVFFILILVCTISYLRINKRHKDRSQFRYMFYIGRPMTQIFIVIMIVSTILMTLEYGKIRTFEEVVACEQTAEILSLKIQVGQKEYYMIKNQESIHKIITAFEETTYVPSFKESSILMKGAIAGREITLEFLGMDVVDSVTISSRGILYNNSTGRAYGYNYEKLYEIIEQELRIKPNS